MSNLESEPRTKSSATGNGASGLAPVEAIAMKDTRRLKRTLVMAGVFALLAMIYVPAPAPRPNFAAHYRFIFSQHETGIAFFQLLVNVLFAGIVGALAANIPKRFFVWFRRCFLSKRAAAVYFIVACIGGLVWMALADQAQQAKRQAEQARAQAEQARQVERARRQAEENERAEQLAAEQAKQAEAEKENVKRAANNQLQQHQSRGAPAFETDPYEEAQCRAPLNYPPVKWDHQTEFGKTFAIIKFRERNAGDRKKELDGYAKAIGARFYKQWSRVRKGGADFVEVVFYK